MTHISPSSHCVAIVSADDVSAERLRMQLHILRPTWSISIVDLHRLRHGSFDAVLVRLSSGADFARTALQIATLSSPSTPKLAIGAASPDVGLAGAFHRFIEHDASDEEIVRSIERSTELRQRVCDPGVLTLVESIDGLPSPTESVRRLNTLLQAREVATADVADVIASDPAMTVKLLQLVNSAFFGLSNRVVDVRQAVLLLGVNTVRNLLSAVELTRAFDLRHSQLGDDVVSLHSHSLAVATLARTLMADRRSAHDAFAAGMLHDIGMLAVISAMPARFVELKAALADNKASVAECEKHVLGTTHENIGAYLLDQWGLPTTLVEAVARSHDARDLSTQSMEPVHSVFVAEQLLSVLGTSSMPWERGSFLDDEFIEALGINEIVTQMISGSSVG